MEMIELPSRAWLEKGEAEDAPAGTQAGSSRGGPTQAQDAQLAAEAKKVGGKKKGTLSSFFDLVTIN